MTNYEVLGSETPRGQIDQYEEENWEQIETSAKKRCVKALQDFLGSELPEAALTKWRDQYQRGVRIGSDDSWFHFGIGMSIRNVLRLEISENNLPWVTYPDGRQYRNWDDYYMPALREALGLERQ